MHGETKRKSSFSAPITKPIRKAGGQERLAQRRRDERQAIGWLRIDRGAQLSADRNHQRLLRLLLVDGDHVAAYVLAAHFHEITAPLARSERQLESEPRHGADRVPRFIGGDVMFLPCEKAIAPDLG